MLKIKCPRHPRYNGKLSPRASCPFCLAIHTLRLRAITDRLIVVESPKEAQS